MSYRIDQRMLELAMSRCVDSAVHNAVQRFERELGEHQGLAHRIAHAAAESAMEQFASYCNAELRLIQIDHERRADEAALRMPEYFIANAPKEG